MCQQTKTLMKKEAQAKTVVLVDDDQYLRDMYALKFREKGFEVEALGSVAEALEKLRGGLTPDIIVFDMVMPGASGYDLLEALAQEKLAPNAAKIALSNEGQDADVEKAAALGSHGYIVKANTVPSEVVTQVVELAAAR